MASAAAETTSEDDAEATIDRARAAERARVLALVEPRSAALAARVREVDDEYQGVDAREAGPFVVVEFSEWGSGVDGGWSAEAVVLSADGTVALRLARGGMDGQYVSSVEPEPALDAAHADALRAAIGTGHWIESASDPWAALARLFLTVVSSPTRTRVDGAVVVGPLYAPSSAVAGRPEGGECVDGAPTGQTPLLYVAPAMLGGAAPAWRGEDDEGEGTASSLVSVGSVAACAQVAHEGDVELHAHAMGGRNGGDLVALYDVATDRHRWVLETRYAVRGSSVAWLGREGGVVFGAYRSDHGAYVYAGHAGIVAIRIRDGAAFRIDVPRAFEDDEQVIDPDAEPPSDHEGRVEACVEERAGALGVDLDESELPAAERARCEEREREVVLEAGTLRVRDARGGWISLDARRLASRIERIAAPSR